MFELELGGQNALSHPSSKFGIKKEGHAPLMQQQFPMDSGAAGEEQRHRANMRTVSRSNVRF